MKTKFLNLLFVQLLMLCSLVATTSCSSDDDDAPTPTIVGSWSCTSVTGFTLQFNPNLTGKEILKSDGNYLEGDFEYIYDKENSILKIIGSNENLILENGTYKNVTVGLNKMDFQGLTFTRN